MADPRPEAPDAGSAVSIPTHLACVVLACLRDDLLPGQRKAVQALRVATWDALAAGWTDATPPARAAAAENGATRTEWIDDPFADLWSIVHEEDEDLRERAGRDYVAALKAALASRAAPSVRAVTLEEMAERLQTVLLSFGFYVGMGSACAWLRGVLTGLPPGPERDAKLSAILARLSDQAPPVPAGAAAGDGLRKAARAMVDAARSAQDVYGLPPILLRKVDALDTAIASAEADGGATFQARNAAWMVEVMHDDPTDLAERVHRFTEEALELGQALGQTREDVRQIADYVHGRPKGEPRQEVGGALGTLTLLCVFAGLDMMACGEAEFARVSTPEIRRKIREKRSKRHGRGPLPGLYAPDFTPAPASAAGEASDDALR